MTTAKTRPTPPETSAAEVLLRALKAHGIDYFFANPGTDFAPIVEAFARSQKLGAAVPKPMVIPSASLARVPRVRPRPSRRQPRKSRT